MSELHKLAHAMRALDRLATGDQALEPSKHHKTDLAVIRAAVGELADENTRLRAENELLRQNEAHFRELFNATYDGILLLDVEQGRILKANEPACRLLGYSPEEIRELTISDLHPYEVPRFLEFASQVARNGKWQSHELSCRAKWGELIPAELSATAVQYDGRPCMLVLVHDMREHRLAKLGLAVSKIGHDLRNILATTQLLTDRVAESRDPEIQRISPRLIDSIDRAIQLCTETLSHGKAISPKPRYRTFELRPLTEDVAATAGKTGIVWRNDVPADFVLRADPDQLFRALLNLVRNARQAIEAGGRGEIRITAARSRQRVRIEVADTGPGLSPAARERLFQPFATVGRAQGTGLGLLIARELVRGHGGDLMLVKSDQHGTIFRLEMAD